MVPMALIWRIYHFWAQFWPYFNFVDFRAYFGPFFLVNRVQFSNADAGAWNSFLRLGIIFYGKLMHKDTKFCYLRFDISTFGFKAPPYCWLLCKPIDGTRQQKPFQFIYSHHNHHRQPLAIIQTHKHELMCKHFQSNGVMLILTLCNVQRRSVCQ